MRCHFNYCLYNEDSYYLLDEITVNTAGQCEECILVSFEEEDLKKCKKKQLDEIINSN